MLVAWALISLLTNGYLPLVRCVRYEMALGGISSDHQRCLLAACKMMLLRLQVNSRGVFDWDCFADTCAGQHC
jgi:hypothetical protein